MSLEADHELIAGDPALPELGQVLDPIWLGERLAEPCLETVADLVISYVRYKPAVSCLVSGRCAIQGRQVPFQAVTFGASLDKLAGWQRGGGKRLSTHSIAFLFPVDPELHCLPELFRADSGLDLVSRVLDDLNPAGAIALTVVAYKPQRRCVLRVDGDGHPTASLKVYEADRYERARRNSKIIIRGRDVRTANRLGRAGSKSIIAFEWLDGRVWVDDLVGSRSGVADAGRIGTALAQFHTLGRGQLHRAAAFHPPELSPFAGALRALGDRFALRVQKLCDTLQDSRPTRTPDTLCHGDFYPKQVVLSKSDGVGFIDMDDAHVGLAEDDLGNCFAHLHRMELADRISSKINEATRAAMLESYRQAGGQIDDATLEHATAYSLFRLAMQPFRDREASWPDAVDAILCRAADIGEGARS